MILGEDCLRDRKDNGPEILAPMRKPALNVVRSTSTGKKQSMRGKLKMAGWDNDILLNPVSFASSLAKDVEGKKTPNATALSKKLLQSAKKRRNHQRCRDVNYCHPD